MKQEQTNTSLVIRLIVPTILAVCFTLSLVGVVSYKLSEELYTAQTETTLENNLNLTTRGLEEAWKNTYGVTFRTTESLKKYVQEVLEGRLDLLIFPEGSGVLVLDKHTDTLIHAYPEGRVLSSETIRNIHLYTIKQRQVSQLPSGLFFTVDDFNTLGISIVAYNTLPFEKSRMAPLMRFTIMSTLLLGGLLLVILMLVILSYSVIRPFQIISAKIQTILENENFHHQIPGHQGAKEIQDLTAQFNTLLSYVEERDNALSAHNDKLEELVEARTAALRKAQSKLIHTERLAAIGEFASSISHELRNPLSSIKLGIDHIAALPEMTGNNRRRAELIQKEVTRLSRMLKGILSFASPAPLDLQAYELTTILTDIQPILTGLAVEYKVVFTVDVDEPLSVLADADKLKQALINVIKNAMEATTDTVRFSVTQAGGQARLVVFNEAPPISEEILGRLFDPFFTTKADGTGLGLPTTKKLMEEMQGNLSIENVSKGVQCVLTLPLVPVEKTPQK